MWYPEVWYPEVECNGVVDPIEGEWLRELNAHLDAHLTERMYWQLGRLEYKERLEKAARAVADIFNSPLEVNR